MKKIELLAPAGDLEKLKIAVLYGADAVYFGGEVFSLRAGAGNLTIDEMKEGIAFAHERGVKCYLTINIFAHNRDIQPLRNYLEKIKALNIDAFIVRYTVYEEKVRIRISRLRRIYCLSKAAACHHYHSRSVICSFFHS